MKKLINRKLGKFNLVAENICKLRCGCGWNITLCGEDIKDLKEIKKYLKNYVYPK